MRFSPGCSCCGESECCVCEVAWPATDLSFSISGLSETNPPFGVGPSHCSCPCSVLNRTYVLSRNTTACDSFGMSEYPLAECFPPTGECSMRLVVSMLCGFDAEGDYLLLRISIDNPIWGHGCAPCSVSAYYICLVSDWDCSGPNVMEFLDTDMYCATFPATINLT